MELIQQSIVEVEPTKTKEKEPGPGLFDYINMLSWTKEVPDFNDHFNRTYSQYVVNLYFSLYQDTATVANLIQSTPLELSNQTHFLYMHWTIARRKRPWVKWFKKAAIDNDVRLIMDTFEYNEVKARESLDLLTPEQLGIMETRQFKGGLVKSRRKNDKT